MLGGMTAPHDFSPELSVACGLAREAGALLLAHRRAGFTVEHKTGADDPVTVADREAMTYQQWLLRLKSCQ